LLGSDFRNIKNSSSFSLDVTISDILKLKQLPGGLDISENEVSDALELGSKALFDGRARGIE
jgi:hypothetical protein